MTRALAVWLTITLWMTIVASCGSAGDDAPSDEGEGSADAVSDSGVADVAPNVPVAPVVVEEGERCDAEAICGDPTVCADGLDCIALGAGATPFCLRSCSMDDDSACGEDERLSCTALSGTDAGHCYVDTESCVTDADCDFGDTFSGYKCRALAGCRRTCEPAFRIRFDIGNACQQWGADACLPELCSVNATCVAGSCTAVEEVPAGAACSLEFTDTSVKPLVCADGNVCVSDRRDDGYGQCAVACDVNTPCVDESETCVESAAGLVCIGECTTTDDCRLDIHVCENGTCQSPTPLIGLGALEDCTVSPGFFPEARYCRNGLTCYQPPREPSGVCLDQCSVPANDCPLEGDVCAQFSGNLGACLPTCVEDSECPLGSLCADFGETRHCRLSRPTGPRGLGQTCDLRSYERLCQPDLLCLLNPATRTGVCSAHCTVGEDDCPTVGGVVGECIEIFGERTGGCAFFCDVDDDCPRQLGCLDGWCLSER